MDSSLALLGRLRLVAGIEARSDADWVWLRGPELTDSLSVALRSSPDVERFLVDRDQLMAWGESVPCASLPTGDWRLLPEWLTVKLPTAAFAAVVESKVPLKLMRSEHAAESNIIKTTWAAWRDYGTSAPQVRLNPLSFAVSDRCEALVRGEPVPPIPGQRYVEAGGIALPAGWVPDPGLDRDSIRQRLGVPGEHLAVFREDGQFELIPDSVFVHASRSAIRATDEALKPA
jgi:hypothetical protein